MHDPAPAHDPDLDYHLKPDVDPSLDPQRARLHASKPPAASAEAQVIPFPRRTRWAILLVAAVAAAIAILHAPSPSPRATPCRRRRARPSRLEVATQLRHDAYRDCDEARWQDCVDKLDHARALDVHGDDAVRVQQYRAAAARALLPPPPAPVPSIDERKGPADKKAP